MIRPLTSGMDHRSDQPQTEVTSDHTNVRSNQIPDPVILVWEHTMCVGLGLIRGHFRMVPQLGMHAKKQVANENTYVGKLVKKIPTENEKILK